MVSIAIEPAPGDQIPGNNLEIDVTPAPAPQVSTLIKNTDFWPNIDLKQYREDMRQDGTITQPRLLEAARNAINEVNDRLANWRKQQQGAGYSELDQVPADRLDDESTRVQLYRRAVFCLTQASLTERFRSFDATNSGSKRAESLEPTVDDLRRDADWAINDCQSLPRMTIELI
ncbi:head completion/stabilization protein [Serratia liquefaciens]|uniref:head completion/stabilization protein n=1 Tax=Serratia liquefaciens TaxID=614 RepID=UPI001C2C9430|nr:head completion/stabilization protein [Serratia liquefaciens]MBV0841366.1 head completion/stabilization protein [Serratia liquefaciens]